MNILGISSFYHDSSATIIVDGRIIAAAAEERFSRIKHDNSFPNHAIDFCLQYSNLAANELDYIVFHEKPVLKFERLLSQHIKHFPYSYRTFIQSIPSWISQKLNIEKLLRQDLHYTGPVLYAPHHLSHASSSYYLSGFDQASIINVDGVGEWATTTIGLGNNANISLNRELHFPHSLGLLYSTITAFLGFRVNNSEYKVMGLAAYGNPNTFSSQFNKLIALKKDGSFSLNMKYFTFDWSNTMYNSHLERLFGFTPRHPESDIKSHHQDVAAALQNTFEKTLFNLLNATHSKHKISQLCYAGGVALNSTANGKIINNTPYKNVFVPPDPGDGGASMGAAIFAHTQLSNKPLNLHFTPYLGPTYPWYQLHQAIRQSGLRYKLFNSNSRLINQVVRYLTEDKVIGWFQGRMEWGPRALGNRSILAQATKAEMRDIINLKIKKREMFRPFAPVILEEYLPKYFHSQSQPKSLAKYMLTVLPFKSIGKKKIPATAHVNNTGRPQTINETDNPLYYHLIKAYFKKTSIPAIINTSFNVRGEPIVNSPSEAISCFLNTELDILVMDKYIIYKD